MRANDSKLYPGCLNKLVGQCNNTYCSICKKSTDADYSDYSELLSYQI